MRVGDEEGATGQREALHAAQTGAHDALYMQCCVCGHVHTLHTCIQASTGVCIIGGSWSVIDYIFYIYIYILYSIYIYIYIYILYIYIYSIYIYVYIYIYIYIYVRIIRGS